MDSRLESSRGISRKSAANERSTANHVSQALEGEGGAQSGVCSRLELP